MMKWAYGEIALITTVKWAKSKINKRSNGEVVLQWNVHTVKSSYGESRCSEMFYGEIHYGKTYIKICICWDIWVLSQFLKIRLRLHLFETNSCSAPAPDVITTLNFRAPIATSLRYFATLQLLS